MTRGAICAKDETLVSGHGPPHRISRGIHLAHTGLANRPAGRWARRRTFRSDRNYLATRRGERILRALHYGCLACVPRRWPKAEIKGSPEILGSRHENGTRDACGSRQKNHYQAGNYNDDKELLPHFIPPWIFLYRKFEPKSTNLTDNSQRALFNIISSPSLLTRGKISQFTQQLQLPSGFQV